MADDVATINPMAESVADLQTLIEKLTTATTSHDVQDALLAVKDFVSDKTNAGLIGGAIGELVNMADAVLSQLENDPEALGGGFSFAFNANFSQQTIDTQNFYKNVTSFSFSFSFKTDDTQMNGSMSFKESLMANDKGVKYTAQENVAVSVVTFNANLEQNKALQAFNNITEKLTGVDLSAFFEDTQHAAPGKEHPNRIGIYPVIATWELLSVQRARLEYTEQATQTLMERLQSLYNDSGSEASGEQEALSA